MFDYLKSSHGSNIYAWAQTVIYIWDVAISQKMKIQYDQFFEESRTNLSGDMSDFPRGCS